MRNFFSAQRATSAFLRTSVVFGLLLLLLTLSLAPKQHASRAPNHNSIVDLGQSRTDRNANTYNQPKDATPLKVFLLAGQSNMVGMGSLKHLDLLVQDNNNNNGTQNEYRQTLWNGTAYKERSDVYMIYQDHHGPLTVGRQYAGRNSFGPELMFGWTLGDALREKHDSQQQQQQPILLLKTAWGGRDLAVDFRPPSAGTGPYGAWVGR